MTTKQRSTCHTMTPDKATMLETGVERVEITARKIYVTYTTGAVVSEHYAHRDLTWLITVQDFEEYVRTSRRFVSFRADGTKSYFKADGTKVSI